MSFYKSILECVLIPLTVTGTGGTVAYGSIKVIGKKVSRSVVDPSSKKVKKTVIKNRQQSETKKSTEIDIEKQLKSAYILSEKIIRKPINVKYGQKKDKKTATILYVLRPSGEGWSKTSKTIKIKINNQQQTVKLWKSTKGSECRFSWELLNASKRSEKGKGKGKGLKDFFECEKCEKKGITISENSKKKE